MNFWESIQGPMTLELTGANVPESLRRIAAAGIFLSGVIPTGPLSVRFSIHRKDYRILSVLCEKQGDRLRILKKSGLFWSVRDLLHRPVLMVGMGLLLSVMLFLPTRVFFLEVDGNRTVPAAEIIEASGIPFGVSRRSLRSEQIKNGLLARIPALKWAGVNTRGMTAVISVRERTVPRIPQTGPGICHIVSAADGIVESCTATGGTLLCAPGEAVTKGQVLISGYTDSGRTLGYTAPDGTVFARTRRTFSSVTPSKTVLKGKETGKKRVYRLLIGKKQIKFGKDSGISPSTCGRMYVEYYITLPGNFTLPLGLGVEEYRYYETESMPVLPVSAGQLLTSCARQALSERMVAGQILSAREDITSGDGLWKLSGTYLCHEMIGRVRQEQIGE